MLGAPGVTSGMNDDATLGTFFRAIGNRVLYTQDHLWHEVGPRVFFPLPFHRPFLIASHDLKTLWKNGALFLRYPIDCGTSGYSSYIFLLTDKNYGLPALSGKSRNQTRRGLENCSVHRISFDRVLHEGMPLVADTLSRQNRHFTESTSSYWQKFLFSC